MESGAKPPRRASAQVAKAELMLGSAGRDASRDVPCVTQHSEDENQASVRPAA